MKLIITKNDILEKFNLPIGIEVEIEGEHKLIPKKITAQAFPQFEGKIRKELYKHLKKEYSGKLSGEDEISDIFKNPEKYSELKDGNWYYFFGAMFCSTAGDWLVPCVNWDGSKFGRYGSWLDCDWGSYGRVVFLETAP